MLTALLVILGVVILGMLGLLAWAGWQLWIDHEAQKAHDERLANLQRICESKPWPTAKGPKGIHLGACLSEGVMNQNAVCWLCFVVRVETRLNDDSRCPIHGLVKDRVLGLVRVDTRLLDDKRRAS